MAQNTAQNLLAKLDSAAMAIEDPFGVTVEGDLQHAFVALFQISFCSFGDSQDAVGTGFCLRLLEVARRFQHARTGAGGMVSRGGNDLLQFGGVARQRIG